MDNKLSQVLSNKELMEKITALIKGEEPAPPPSEPATVLAPSKSADKGLALLSALAPFLKESRRKKLESAEGLISVISAYKNMKKL